MLLDQRNVAHFQSWPCDQQMGLWSRKIGSRVDFLKITFWKVCHASEYSVILHHFSQNFWLCKPVENFLYIVHIRYGYLKHAARSEKCSALWIIFVRHVFRKLSLKRQTPHPYGQNGGGYYTLASLATTSLWHNALIYTRIFLGT